MIKDVDTLLNELYLARQDIIRRKKYFPEAVVFSTRSKSEIFALLGVSDYEGVKDLMLMDMVVHWSDNLPADEFILTEKTNHFKFNTTEH